jgi:hypothetical protein
LWWLLPEGVGVAAGGVFLPSLCRNC